MLLARCAVRCLNLGSILPSIKNLLTVKCLELDMKINFMSVQVRCKPWKSLVSELSGFQYSWHRCKELSEGVFRKNIIKSKLTFRVKSFKILVAFQKYTFSMNFLKTSRIHVFQTFLQPNELKFLVPFAISFLKCNVYYY